MPVDITGINVYKRSLKLFSRKSLYKINRTPKSMTLCDYVKDAFINYCEGYKPQVIYRNNSNNLKSVLKDEHGRKLLNWCKTFVKDNKVYSDTLLWNGNRRLVVKDLFTGKKIEQRQESDKYITRSLYDDSEKLVSLQKYQDNRFFSILKSWVRDVNGRLVKVNKERFEDNNPYV